MVEIITKLPPTEKDFKSFLSQKNFLVQDDLTNRKHSKGANRTFRSQYNMKINNPNVAGGIS